MIESNRREPAVQETVQETVHHRQLYLPRSSFVHRLNPAIKIVATLLFVVASALVPRYEITAPLINLIVLLTVIVAARLPFRTVIRRLSVLVPFVTFAFFIPLIASGPTTEFAGVALSTEGLWASWSIVSKAVIGTGASIVLSSSTSIPELLRGLSVLRVPTVIVAIIAFMFRYLDLIFGQIHRTRNAMIARAHDPRWLWQAQPMAASAGALFVRTYERGERAHLSMMARGYNGSMPDLSPVQVRPSSSTRYSVLAWILPAVAWLNLLISSQSGWLS